VRRRREEEARREKTNKNNQPKVLAEKPPTRAFGANMRYI